MDDDPIKAPRPGPLSDNALTHLMNASMEALVETFPPGAVLTLTATFPENFPGMVVLKPGARTNYISNGSRDDMANAMIELLRRWGKI